MNKFVVRGFGFFNGSYDLFVMNVVNVLLTEQYGKQVYSTHMKSAVSAAALIGAAVGQLLFGVLGDMYGRKKNMIATCVILIVGGVFCTCAYGGTPSRTLWFLVGARGLLGIGVGGEYPLAAATMAEDANSVAHRNYRVALTFSLQGVASLLASILGNLLIQALANGPKGENDPHRLELVWRLLFGIGILPACVVCYYRINAPETEAYKAVQVRRRAIAAERKERPRRWTRIRFILKHYGKGLLGTAGTWFLFDIVFYAQNMFSASILSVIGVTDASLQVVSTQNAVGPTLWDDLKHNNAVAFILLYGLALFFSNFGPNMSTFIMPTEMFPTPIRSTCHGFSAAMGKAGAALGSFGFGFWVDNKRFGYTGAFYIFGGIALISIPLTWFCLFDSELRVAEMDDEFFEKLLQEDREHARGDSFASAVMKANGEQ
uniref:Major facilitator superfamily (MFS) profile domain-containing protein n=1 Tax=Globisporangium ultimum (strain ATCC 200006 / CBS 805.95 / DAOM BR144) TaxID=431595 RepID=K3W5W2_GLOUD